jgi:hypothetical protein
MIILNKLFGDIPTPHINYLKLFGRWWDCIALPDDVDPTDEGAFRMQIKNLACTVGVSVV